ncbi:uncharacterized protein LOC126737480 [Anthonomus grandis grandis]|uniref:uncharacterized protein LOC126737480 n=1 Tax=Anthonomus grandis grandis TaxID=2921223 RepID=UPI002166351A|nr:uncharacterized protein LOC126737480 [Anthonomus grandis grandis]
MYKSQFTGYLINCFIIMKSVLFVSLVLLLAIGFSAAVSSCYSCLGNSTACPFSPTEAQITAMKKMSCSSYTTSTICSKYAILFPNGEYYTFRGCSPKNVGGTNQGEDFCSFVQTLYEPLIQNGVISSSSCSACYTIDCNT